MFKLIWECKDVYLKVIREKRMLCTLALIASYTLITTVNNNYFALFLCGRLGLPESNVSLLVTFKSLVMLFSMLILTPRLKQMPFRRPMLASWASFAASQILLLTNPGGVFLVPMLLAELMLEGIAMSVLSPMTSSLLFINADPDERARVCGLVYATISLIVAVFPTIIGALANVSLVLPFMVNLCLFAFGAIMTVVIARLPTPDGYDRAA